jgi:hypothetical protein
MLYSFFFVPRLMGVSSESYPEYNPEPLVELSVLIGYNKKLYFRAEFLFLQCHVNIP